MLLIGKFLTDLISIYSYIIIIYIFMSWFNAQQTSIGQLFARICEPYLEIFRRFIPPIGMIDISPIVAIIVLRFASYGLFQLFLWTI
ncbi:YggT family protein [Bacillus sp. Gen3]|uniref:YggT family protein n=1 Tax=Heyndrickxia oleronia TaxID=38875 RepID=UPI000716E984|nr:YggT family protein [Heyndrickxia oleronia]MBU5210986.1 YggT family protein [Heyndrickxia oleronia]NYV67686.1 YggT family protein [Bacillus sp. Gen3]